MAAAADEAMEDLRILYEDKFLVLCVKPVGVLSEDSDTAACMPALLRQHYRALGQNDYIATVHRLDKAVGGVMLFSRRRDVTGKLTAAVAEHRVTKEYLAVLRDTRRRPPPPSPTCCSGTPPRTRAMWSSGCARASGCLAGICDAGQHGGADAGARPAPHWPHPPDPRAVLLPGPAAAGDIRYGSKADCSTALWSYHMAFTHPVTGRTVDVTCPPPESWPWTLFNTDTYA